MKKLIYILPILALLCGCSDDEPVTIKGTGLSVKVNIDDSYLSRTVSPLTNFSGYTFTLNNEVVTLPTDGHLTDLDPGSYTLSMTNYNEAHRPAFSNPRYSGQAAAEVQSGVMTPVELTLTQANAGIYFTYDKSLEESGLGDIVATIFQSEEERLTFDEDNRTKTGYFKPGIWNIEIRQGDQIVRILQEKESVVELKARQMYEAVLMVRKGEMGVISIQINELTEPTDNHKVEIHPGYSTPALGSGNIANSYMIQTGGSATIPVGWVYEVWEKFFMERISGAPEARLLWMDEEGAMGSTGVISSYSLDNTDPGDNTDYNIIVNAGSKEGNALIALALDGEIVWSWHIWVTDYDPEIAANQKRSGENILMDRNLGALNTTPGDIHSVGLYYQWGRKDPFPRPATAAVDRRGQYPGAIYGENGQILTLGLMDKYHEVTREGDVMWYRPVPLDSEIENVNYSLQNPTHFIYFVPYIAQMPVPGGWTMSPRYMEVPTNKLLNDLWNTKTSNRKTVFDPCPAGWRVPNDLEIFADARGKYDKPTEGMGQIIGESGYFPCTGLYENQTGVIMNMGLPGYVWHALDAGYGGRVLEFDPDGRINTPGGQYQPGDPTAEFQNRMLFRGYGANVRCVRE